MKATEFLSRLPSVFQRTAQEGTPLLAILNVMEGMHEPVEEQARLFPNCLDPYAAPESFLPFLAGWVDLDWLLAPGARHGQVELAQALPAGVGRLRDLIAMAAVISEWRGTAFGLCLILELATGIPGFEVSETVSGADGRIRPFHICIRGSNAAEPFRKMIEYIIEFEKPVHLTAEFTTYPSGDSHE